MYKHILAAIFVVVMMGCQGGDSSSSETSSTSSSSSSSLFSSSSSSQGSSSSDSNASIEIELVPDDANVTLERINAYDITSTKVAKSFRNNRDILTLELIGEDIVSKAIFMDGLFQGIVESQATVAGKTELTLRQPDDISEVLESYEINVDASSAQVAKNPQQRQRQGIGKYDYLNTNPLTYEVRNVSHYDAKKRSMVQEPVLRVNIPKGYTFPIKREKTELNIDDKKRASVTFNHEINQHYDLEYTTTESNITVTTDGSYVEFGLATYFHAAGRLSLVKSRRYAKFEFSQSAYFTSNLELMIFGQFEDEWSTAVDLINSEIHVYIPVTNVVMVDINFRPSIRLGASGRITGLLEAESFATRNGSYEVTYDSRRDSNKLRTSSDIDSDARDMDNHSVDININASANSYVTPTLSILPGASIGGLMSITTLSLNGGIRVDADIEGSIDYGFVVNNEEEDISLEAVSSLNISTTPWLSYQVYVSLDPIVGGDVVFYEGNEQMLYEGDPLEIMHWEARLLPAPQILEVELNGSSHISFAINTAAHIHPYVKYYYSLNGTIPTESVENLWDGNPVLISRDSRVVVKAIAQTSDYVDTMWAFGKSISPTVIKNVEAIIPNPSVVVGLKTEGFNTSINLTWDESNNTEYYTIWASDNILSGYTYAGTTQTTEFVYSTLSHDEQFFKILACRTGDICSEFSEPVSGQVASVIKSKATADAGEDQVGIHLTKEKIRLDASGSSTTLGSIVSYTWRENGTVLSTDMIYEATHAFGTHTIELEVRDTNGNTDTDTVIVKIKNLPTTPTGFEATSGFNSVNLKWNNSVDVSYYQIYHDKDEDGFYDWLVEIEHPTGNLNLMFSTYTHSVEDGDLHYYKIRSCDRELDRCSSFSNVISGQRNPTLIFIK